MLSVLLLTVLATAAEKDPGRALFDAWGCRSCHKVGAEGGNAGPDLTTVGLRHSRGWMTKWILRPQSWKKKAKMPPHLIDDPDRETIVEWLSEQKGQAWGDRRPWKDEPDSLAKGRLIFKKAGCVACHGVKGRGGEPNNNVKGGVIPALDKLIGTYTAAELRQRILDGKKPQKDDAAGPDPAVEMPAWKGVLDEQELDALVAYLQTLAKPTEAW